VQNFLVIDIQRTASPNARFLVRASYLQIYNEVISDLLKPERANLQIREDRRRGVFVENMSEWVVRSPREVYGQWRPLVSLLSISASIVLTLTDNDDDDGCCVLRLD
jgi:hypothetical protein